MRKLTALLLIIFYCTTVGAKASPPIVWHGYIKAEDVTNAHGGIKTGSVLNGSAKLVATYADSLQVGVLGATHTQRQNLYTGSVQHTTSLDAQREIRLAELSYKHTLGRYVTGHIGVMDLEDFYDITEAAIYLRNSAFVNAMALDKNTQLATFPYPGFGAMLEFKQHKNYALLGLYQGNPQHLHTVFYRGYMLIGEVGTTQDFTFKLGAWIYQASSTPDYSNARGAYLITQFDWQYYRHEIAPFLQLAYSNETPKYIPYSLTLGTRVNNIFRHNNSDWLSFGIGKVWIYHEPSEVVCELSYVLKFWDKFYLTPDLQYFVKPSGVNPNATVLILRLSYRF